MNPVAFSPCARRTLVFPGGCGIRVPRGSAVLICVLLTAGLAQARIHRSQGWAEEQFDKAESQRETLQGRAEQARTRHQYQTVIASYRRIVLEAPTSSKADGSAFLVAELTAEMGRHFKDQMALYSAVREYKYLRREYPGSKHRVEALLAIGEIYKNDLDDEADARSAFEDFLRRYQHTDLVKEARAELAALNANSSDLDSDQSSDASDDSNSASDAGNDANDRDASSKSAPSANSEADGSAKEQIVRVTSVDHRSAEDYTRITVNLEQDVQFVSARVDHPDRIFFDLKNARVPSRLNDSSLSIDDGRVKRIRIAQFKPGRARIVIETDGRESYNASLVLNPPRLVIDIHDSANAACGKDGSRKGCRQDDSGPAVVAATEKSDEPSAAAGPKKVIVDADDGDASSETAAVPEAKSSKHGKSRSKKTQLAAAMPLREAEPTSDGERSLIRTLGLRIGKIVIDPGHGGHDTGTIGPDGLMEKDLVLDVSKRLGKLLQARLGAQVVFTRRDDTFIPLETRTAIANQEQADLFVSVHANSSHDPDARGVETYYLNFTSSPEALEVAARENADSDKSIHELQDLVKKIALKEKIEESREFASDVQQSLHAGLAARNPGERDRGVKKAPFVVLIGANMPSILAEISFLSNPGDERRLRTPEYRQRIAESLYRGIARYVNGLGGLNVASKIEKSTAE